MTEDDLVADARILSRWEKHKFMVLVGMTILISLFLVMVSLRLYDSSGAAQLDLSRPGYESVRKQASHTAGFTGFSANGPLDKEALEEFRKLYDEQLKQATAIDSFGGDVMSDAALGLTPPPSQ